MAVSDFAETGLRLAARRAYERGRLAGALVRGAAAAALALPGFFLCSQTPWASVCLAGFALVVAAARFRGEEFEAGARAGAVAGIVPCLLPVAVRVVDVDLCAALFAHGVWLCGIGGAAAGVVLGLRSRAAHGLAFWGSAVAAMAFPATLGCIPAGAMGFAGLAVGVFAGGVPILASRKALV